MTRTELMELATKHRGNRTALRAAVAARLTQNALQKAPRIFDVPGGRKVTLAEATDALLQEIT